ncbi:MAG: histidine kinase dimerization/phospho-acceptor domain-containing protein [bacterium]
MRQILYDGGMNVALKESCNSIYRCISIDEVENIEKFVGEVMTDAIVLNLDRFMLEKTRFLYLSKRDRLPIILLLKDSSEIKKISLEIDNMLVDFILASSSAEELDLRIEKIIAVKNTNMALNEMNSIQHEVNRMAKLSIAGELIASISHMINNPITAMNLQLDLLRMEKSLSKDSIERIDSIESNIERIISIVSTVRELKLGTSEKNEMINVREEMMKYMPLLHDYFINHSININYTIDEKIPPVRLHHGLLKYIFLEIMLLLLHGCKDRRSGKLDICISSESGNVRFLFKTDFVCNLEKIGLSVADESDKSDSLTVSALKADINDSSGIMYMEDMNDGSVIAITLPAASI